jgi:hypothetical protein
VNIVNLFLDAKKDELVKQLSESFGMDTSKTSSVVSSLVSTMEKKSQSVGAGAGIAGIMTALSSLNIQDVLAGPQTMDSDEVQEQGNAVLGVLLGGDTEKESILSAVAAKAGVDTALVAKMLPAIIASAAGYFKSTMASTEGDLGSLMAGVIDRDGDGSIMDDVAGFAKKLF